MFRKICESLSARRAWIEMWMKSKLDDAREVALRKESVDRNRMSKILREEDLSRSPQGERG